MRIPRNQQIAKGDIVHTTWRGHNKEWIFKTAADKRTYLELLDQAAAEYEYKQHAYDIMSSHEHNLGEAETVEGYSSFFKEVHGRYAQRYNRVNERTGAVGTGRPMSTVVKDERHLLNAMFYCDANPVRAGLVRHPRFYPWSSHNFYAYGTWGPGSASLDPPEWYLNLGKTPGARQRAYRRQCDAYLRHVGLLPAPGQSSLCYAGRARREGDAEERRTRVRGASGSPGVREVGGDAGWPPRALAGDTS